MSNLRVLIQGGGIAGRTAAKSIITKLPNATITVVESRNASEWAQDRGLGLWPAAIKSLKALNVDCTNEFHSISPAAYRANTTNAEWLSKASCANQVKVNTIKENRLLQLLEHDNVQYQYNSTIASLTVDSSGVAATLTSGDTITGDLCIVANGSASSPSSPSSASSASSASNSSATEYSDSLSGIVTSVKGHGPLLQKCCNEGPFELLLSSDIRLAIVPLNSSSLFWFISNAPNSPLPSSVSEAVAHAIHHVKPNYISLETLIGATCPHTLVVRRTHYRNQDHPRNNATVGRTVHIGDASNYLSNNLAQAGSAAIEDGYMVGAVLAQHHASAMSALVDPLDPLDTEQMFHGFATEFKQQKKTRIQQCRSMNAMTSLISKYPNISNLMQYVPPRLNSFIFDQSLVYSLGGKEYV